jgi:hypothetical protein
VRGPNSSELGNEGDQKPRASVFFSHHLIIRGLLGNKRLDLENKEPRTRVAGSGSIIFIIIFNFF